MDVSKWVPWNWFKREEEDAGKAIPVRRGDSPEPAYAPASPLAQLHREMDRLFDNAFRGFGMTPFDFSRRPRFPMMEGLLKPSLDLGATENMYTVTVEIPGVDEKDVKLEIVNDTLSIRGEKKQESEEKDNNYYRVERSYGSFQRVLSLPEDADQNGVKATFKNGILKVTMPRTSLPRSDVKRIEVRSA